jgi:hypothetical protein
VLPAPVGGGSPSLADTSRFAGLIDVYTTLATSDPVIRVLQRRGLIDATQMASGVVPITAAPVVSTVGGGTTPMMMISATAPTAVKATKLTRATTTAFLAEVRARQLAAKIPLRDRIQLQVVKAADEPKLVKPRSKALPMLVLLGGLIATGAVAFTRDNAARRRGAPVLAAASPEEAAEALDPSFGVAHAPTTLGPVPRPDAVASRGESGAPSGTTRGRSTLGSVPRSDSASRDAILDEDAPQAPQLRRTGTAGRPQS